MKSATSTASSTVNRSASSSIGTVSNDEKTRILNRLRRLEGQVRGLQRMIEEERNCRDILTLLSGVRSALDATADAILEKYLETCGTDFASGEGDVQELLNTIKLARG